MLTLLGSLMGFAGSAVPSVIDLFKEKSERQKQLELAKLQGRTRENLNLSPALPTSSQNQNTCGVSRA